MYTATALRYEPSSAPFDAPPAPVRPRKLLLVDDHELVRYGVKSCYTEFQGVPLCWLEATSLQDALAIYAREEDIDAVLLDLNLADCKGLQGLRQFVHEHPGARVAVFSATQDEFVVRQARALGAIGYVPKGAAAGEIREMLSALLWPPSRGSRRCCGRTAGRSRAATRRRMRCSRAFPPPRCTTALPNSDRAISRSSRWCSRAAPTRRSATR
jgi:DNA-binding NarL/FixJ family response regulator